MLKRSSVGFWELTREQQTVLVRLGVTDFLRRWYEGNRRPAMELRSQPYAALETQM